MTGRSIIFFGALAFAAALVCRTAKADTLTGTTVSGSMTTYNDVSVTTQFTSPTVVGSGVEFNGVASDSSFGFTFDISADFYNGGLTVSITSPNANSNIFNSGGLLSLTFSDTAFVTPFALQSFTCATGSNACATLGGLGDNVNYLSSDTLSGSTLTLDFNGLVAGSIYTFSDVPAGAPTPEPSALALLGTGLLGLGVLRRRLS